METDRGRCLRLLGSVETLVGAESFAASRDDWHEVAAMQQRAAPAIAGLGELLAAHALTPTEAAVLASRFHRLQEQHAAIIARAEDRRSRLTERLATVDTAAGRLAGMRRAYGQRPAGREPVLRRSA